MSTQKGLPGFSHGSNANEESKDYQNEVRDDGCDLDSGNTGSLGNRRPDVLGGHELDSNVEKAHRLQFTPMMATALKKFDDYLEKDSIVNKGA